jgi:hypothetical protein
MSLKPITVLRRARKLIADPKSWIKGAFIGKRNGVQCYCALGALATGAGIKVKDGQTLSDAAGQSMPAEYYDAHQFLREEIGSDFSGWTPCFNDAKSTRHADVLAVFDRAIAAAKAKEKAKTVTAPAV